MTASIESEQVAGIDTTESVEMETCVHILTTRVRMQAGAILLALLTIVGCGSVDASPSGCVPCPNPVPTCSAPSRTATVLMAPMQTCGDLTMIYEPTNGAATCWINEPADWPGPADNGDATAYDACISTSNGG